MPLWLWLFVALVLFLFAVIFPLIALWSVLTARGKGPHGRRLYNEKPVVAGPSKKKLGPATLKRLLSRAAFMRHWRYLKPGDRDRAGRRWNPNWGKHQPPRSRFAARMRGAA